MPILDPLLIFFDQISDRQLTKYIDSKSHNCHYMHRRCSSPYLPPPSPPQKKKTTKTQLIMIIMINASCANVGFYSRLSAEFLGYSYISFSNLFRSGWIPIYCYACNVLNVTYWARKKIDQFGIYNLIHETYPGEILTSLSWKKG